MPRGTDTRATEKPSAEEWRALVHLAAGTIAPHDNVKGLIGRAARVLGVSYRRAKSFWYAELDHVRAEEVARLRGERERLLQARVERLGREIAETERLIREARQRHEASVVATVRDAQCSRQLGLPFGRRPA